MKNRVTIGISSIVLIFLILCLSVFCLLSISDARSARSFAERHAASVQMYYEADAAGQAFICCSPGIFPPGMFCLWYGIASGSLPILPGMCPVPAPRIAAIIWI